MSIKTGLQTTIQDTAPCLRASEGYRPPTSSYSDKHDPVDVAISRRPESLRVNYQSGQTYVLRIKTALCSNGFFDQACYKFYQVRLLNRARPLNTLLHAYCLLPDTIYLMVTPMTPTGLHELLASLNKSYSDYFNLRFQRRRKVWQDKPCLHPLPDNAICLEFQKYIERLPVDQGGHSHPGTHPWSSYSHYAFDRCDAHLTMHPRFERFRNMSANSMRRYRDFIASPFNERYRQSLGGTFDS